MGYAATLIGASALALWNVQFSSSTMRVLWRTFSGFSAALPLLCLFLLVVGLNTELKGFAYLFVAATGLHVLSRLVLIVLVFYSFHSLPADVYITPSWLEFFPFFH